MSPILKNLLTIKSIVTIMVMSTFVYLATTQAIDSNTVMLVVTAITTYFFAKPNVDTTEK
jgi:hypothetical protein